MTRDTESGAETSTHSHDIVAVKNIPLQINRGQLCTTTTTNDKPQLSDEVRVPSAMMLCISVVLTTSTGY